MSQEIQQRLACRKPYLSQGTEQKTFLANELVVNVWEVSGVHNHVNAVCFVWAVIVTCSGSQVGYGKHCQRTISIECSAALMSSCCVALLQSTKGL